MLAVDDKAGHQLRAHLPALPVSVRNHKWFEMALLALGLPDIGMPESAPCP